MIMFMLTVSVIFSINLDLNRSVMCQQIVENTHHGFLNPKMMSSDFLFCLSDNQESVVIDFIIRKEANPHILKVGTSKCLAYLLEILCK